MDLSTHFTHRETVTVANTTAVNLLADATDVSKQRLKLAMQCGAVWVTRDGKTQRIRRATKPLAQGDVLHLYYDEALITAKPPEPTLIEDLHHYSVWDKPYGLLSQGSKWGDHHTIGRWAEQHLSQQRPSFVVHRLDRAARGLILVAHSKSAAAALSNLFQKRDIDKRYRVLVHGEFPETPQPKTLNGPLGERSAISHVTKLSFDAGKDESMLEVQIETGRKHQIRRHLADAGFPVVGDRLYGSPDKKRDLQLVAWRLKFICPKTTHHKLFELTEPLFGGDQ